MFRFFPLWFGLLARCFRSYRTLLLENLALRQQLPVLKRRHPKPKAQPPGQTVLGLRLAILVRLEKFSHHRHPGDRGPLAPRRLPQVLESDLQGERASRKEEAIPGDPGSHLPNGER
jgi:hypothetical protein